MFKNVNSRVFSSFFLSLVLVISCMATASAANRGFTKDPDGNKGSQGQIAQASPIKSDGSVSKSFDFGTNEAAVECTVDCGGEKDDWTCWGDTVSCEDGVGCYAEGNDGSFAAGSCEN